MEHKKKEDDTGNVGDRDKNDDEVDHESRGDGSETEISEGEGNETEVSEDYNGESSEDDREDDTDLPSKGKSPWYEPNAVV